MKPFFLDRVVGPGRVSIWESSSGRCVHNLEGPGESVEWVAWHPRGDVILAGSEDFTAWMWNAQSGEMMQVSLCCLFCVHIRPRASCKALPSKHCTRPLTSIVQDFLKQTDFVSMIAATLFAPAHLEQRCRSSMAI